MDCRIREGDVRRIASADGRRGSTRRTVPTPGIVLRQRWPPHVGPSATSSLPAHTRYSQILPLAGTDRAVRVETKSDIRASHTPHPDRVPVAGVQVGSSTRRPTGNRKTLHQSPHGSREPRRRRRRAMSRLGRATSIGRARDVYVPERATSSRPGPPVGRTVRRAATGRRYTPQAYVYVNVTHMTPHIICDLPSAPADETNHIIYTDRSLARERRHCQHPRCALAHHRPLPTSGMHRACWVVTWKAPARWHRPSAQSDLQVRSRS